MAAIPTNGTNSQNVRDNLVSTEYQPFDSGQPKVHFGEKTGFQAVITSPWVMRWAAIPATYQTYRQIRKNSTVALARELAVSPILASEWAVEADKDTPPEWKEFIEETFMPLRDEYLATALYYGDIDFGYQCWEKIINPVDNYLKITKLKQLLHDITEICIGHKGSFIGVRQVGQDLGIANSMHVGFRVEGSYLYGIPLLENIRQVYNWWTDCNEGARRYDKKIAGCHIIVEYPPGSCYDATGHEVENSVLAKNILFTLESAGGIAVPRDMAAFMQSLNLDSPGWKIWILDQGVGHQHSFVDRLEYLDAQFTRGLHIPERAMMQGQHGTQADAEAHSDVIFTIQDIKHRRVTNELNLQAVNQMLYLNFGKEAVGKVKIKASPIADKQKAFFAQIYQELLGSPLGAQEVAKIDLESMRDQLGIPTIPQQEGAIEQPNGPNLQAMPGVSSGTPGGNGKQLMAMGKDGKPVMVDGQQPNIAQALTNAIEGMSSAVALSATALNRVRSIGLTEELNYVPTEYTSEPNSPRFQPYEVVPHPEHHPRTGFRIQTQQGPRTASTPIAEDFPTEAQAHNWAREHGMTPVMGIAQQNSDIEPPEPIPKKPKREKGEKYTNKLQELYKEAKSVPITDEELPTDDDSEITDKWGKGPDDTEVYHFKTNEGSGYKVSIRNDIIRGLPAKNLQFTDASGSMNTTDAGSAPEVLHHVSKAVLSYLHHKKPKAIYFSSKGIGRTNTYQKLATIVKDLTAKDPNGGYQAFMIGSDPEKRNTAKEQYRNPNAPPLYSRGTFLLVHTKDVPAYEEAFKAKYSNPATQLSNEGDTSVNSGFHRITAKADPSWIGLDNTSTGCPRCWALLEAGSTERCGLHQPNSNSPKLDKQNTLPVESGTLTESLPELRMAGTMEDILGARFDNDSEGVSDEHSLASLEGYSS